MCFFLQVVFAPGQSIESNLKNLAERRTDIFGVGDEAASEAMIGQKMGEEEVRLRDHQFHNNFGINLNFCYLIFFLLLFNLDFSNLTYFCYFY